MSDSDSPTDEELEETYADNDAYTVTLNRNEYALNRDFRKAIQERARHAFAENHRFSCWWKTASERDAEKSEIHSQGDPILVIETEGPIVPWDNLDQLEVEMQDTSSFDGVDAGGGMRTVDADAVDSDGSGEEQDRDFFDVTPQEFEEVPSPDGENPDKIPAKPKTFDEPALVKWVPEDPDLDHTWDTGEAIAPVVSWVEWNIQAKADTPTPDGEKDSLHDRFESLVQMHDCEKVGELGPKQEPKPDDNDDDSDDVPKKFREGTAGGNNWRV